MPPARRVLGAALALLGLGLLAFAAVQGDLRVGLFLIVPYLYGTGILPFLGFLLLLAGGVLALTAGVERAPAGPAWEAAPPATGGARARTRHGGFVMLGPIPLVWGNDRRMLPWLVLLGLGLVLLLLALPTLLR